MEVVNLRLRARGVPDKPEFPQARKLVREVSEAGAPGVRAWSSSTAKAARCPSWTARLCCPANELPSPCLLTEYSTTTLVPPFACARVDARDNIVMEIES